MKTNIHRTTSNRLLTLVAAAALVGLFTAAAPARACGDYSGFAPLKKLVALAVSENPAEADDAIASLRQRGPAGLNALLNAHAEKIKERQSARAPQPVDPAWDRLSRAIDTVGQQRDCLASRLFWHTGMEEAKAAARASGKPILSLRLLGRLDEELSCANSRFFRTALYANAEVSSFLRDRFILHWQSVRPVPKITIDFGDGRKLERTLTGNSIHYVLDAEGRPIDALPGLYGPKAFLKGLTQAGEAARQFAARPVAERESYLRDYHRERLAAIATEWNSDLARLGEAPVLAVAHAPGSRGGFGYEPLFVPPSAAPPPTAVAAAKITEGKGRVEMPVLRSLAPRSDLDTKTLEAKMDDAAWSKLAALHADESRLDQGSRELMRRKNPDALAAGRLTVSKVIVEDPLLRAARQFERSMAEDTVRNEYLFHAKIHQWFTGGAAQTREVAMLNDRVYAELFLTPGSDPWLGLKPADAYSAIEGDGVRGPAKK